MSRASFMTAPPARDSLRGDLLRDLLVLSKGRVVLMLVFTALASAALAPGFGRDPGAVLAGLVGLGLAAAAGGALNQLLETALDGHMRRTHDRPLVTGRITRTGAVVFAGALLLGALGVLLAWSNQTTLVLTLAGLVGYGVVYTLLLKKRTPWDIVWGGAAGAVPPLIGWAAVGAPLSPLPLILSLLIFVWTPAHFWALALARREEYRLAGIPVLPVTHGSERTRREILRYSLLTGGVSLLPVALGMAGLLYALVAVVLGTRQIILVGQLKHESGDAPLRRQARQLFRYSLLHLVLLNAGLVVDHWLP